MYILLPTGCYLVCCTRCLILCVLHPAYLHIIHCTRHPQPPSAANDSIRRTHLHIASSICCGVRAGRPRRACTLIVSREDRAVMRDVVWDLYTADLRELLQYQQGDSHNPFGKEECPRQYIATLLLCDSYL